jgi:predicted nucleic acid-binding protein
MDKPIIADTSCLIALSNIDHLFILRDLYSEISITKEVYNEFGNELPNWIVIHEVQNKNKQQEIERSLDKGEASSIALALESRNAVLIIDEIKGRKIAGSLNIEIIGTIGILLQANKIGLLKDVLSVILKMVNNGFRLSDKIVAALLEKYDNE